MANSTVLKGIGALVGLGVIIKTAIVGFYVTEIPWIAIGAGVGYFFFWLGDRAEGRETQAKNDDVRRSTPPTDNW